MNQLLVYHYFRTIGNVDLPCEAAQSEDTETQSTESQSTESPAPCTSASEDRNYHLEESEQSTPSIPERR